VEAKHNRNNELNVDGQSNLPIFMS